MFSPFSKRLRCDPKVAPLSQHVLLGTDRPRNSSTRDANDLQRRNRVFDMARPVGYEALHYEIEHRSSKDWMQIPFVKDEGRNSDTHNQHQEGTDKFLHRPLSRFCNHDTPQPAA